MVSYVRHSYQATSLFESDHKPQAKKHTNKMLKSLLDADPAMLEQLAYSAKLTKYEMKVICEITGFSLHLS